MKKPPFVPFTVCLALFVVRAAAQDHTNPADGVVVQCGSEPVATFSGTRSKDGRYAVGWTIRAKGNNKAPSPWTVCDQADPTTAATLRLLENEDGSPRHGDYRVVDGLVDLKAKRFVPWQGGDFVYAGEAQASMVAVWSGDRQGTRYGVVFNNHEGNSYQATMDLQLVVVGPDGAHLSDLKLAADEAIKAYLQRRDPKDAAHYAWMCNPDVISQDGRQAVTLFKGETLTLPFEASVPQQYQNVDAGRVSFALPQGTVTGTVSDPAARKVLLH